MTRHFAFSNLRTLNGRLTVGVSDASLCQISLKSVKWLQRYGVIVLCFKMAVVHHLGFSNRKFLTPYLVCRTQMHYCALRSNGCRDLMIFLFFKIAAVRHLGFMGHILGPSTKSISRSLSSTKFGWNLLSSFCNMKVLIIIYFVHLAGKCLFMYQ